MTVLDQVDSLSVSERLAAITGIVDELRAGDPVAERDRVLQYDAIRALRATGAFAYVEPDYELTTTLTPTDARFTDGTLWGLNNTGISGGVVLAKITMRMAPRPAVLSGWRRAKNSGIELGRP